MEQELKSSAQSGNVMVRNKTEPKSRTIIRIAQEPSIRQLPVEELEKDAATLQQLSPETPGITALAIGAILTFAFVLR